MSRYARQFAEVLAPAVGLSADEVQGLIVPPPQPGMGELGFPCFALAKQRRQAPPAIAAELAGQLADALPAGGALREVRAVGPYLNAFLDPTVVARQVLPEVLARGTDFGCLDLGRGGQVPVDYSSPNIAKPFGIHHLRSTVIGHALVGLLRAAGYRPVGINHIGDWGTQFGQLLAVWEQQGDEQRLQAEGIGYLLALYVAFNERKAADPGLQDVAREKFKALEAGEPEARRLWKLFRDVSLAEFERIYELLGIRFDLVQGESFYEDLMPAVLDELAAKGLLSESEEATVVDLEGDDLGVALVRKRDGTTLYLTRDLASADWRHRSYDFSRALYVVGAAQALHFAQLKRVLELLGRPWHGAVEHVPFGMMRFKDRKMSTRSGDIILLEEVLQRAVAMARQTMQRGAEEKGRALPDEAELDLLSHQIGVGAVVFNDLKNRRVRDVVFDWDEVLSFEGATGPYLQYTAARIASMGEKLGRAPRADVDFSRLDRPAELQLALAIDGLPGSLARAVAASEPSFVADQLLEVAARFSTLYADRTWKVLTDDTELGDARMLLAHSARQVLVNGLDWLGIPVPARM